MARLWKRFYVIACLASECGFGQAPGVFKAAADPPTPASGIHSITAHSGRETPRATVLGFLRAAQAGKYRLAAQYLQLTETEREHRGAEIAREFSEVLDQLYVGNLDLISNSPEGTLDDGLPSDREVVGGFASESDGPIVLVRVPDKLYGMVWLFAAETLERVPELYAEVGYPYIEQRLPAVLVETRWLGVALWRWIAALLLVPLSLGVAWVLLRLFVTVPMAVYARLRRPTQPGALWVEVRTPVLVLLTMILHYIVIMLSGIPLLYRQYYARVVKISLTVALAWLLWRWINRGIRMAHARVLARGDAEAGSVLLLGQRIVKVLVVTAVFLISLSMLGFEMKTFLAGLGIGGIAVALAAQKTLENVFGGIWMLSDRAIRVGDFCVFGAYRGTVEDIGLRSTRVRTLDRTIVTIPNGQLMNMVVENYALRDKMWFNPTIGLRYETTAPQLRQVLDGIREFLQQHPKIEKDGLRVRLLRLGASSLDVEVFAYILTTDYTEFTAIREELFLRILEIVAAAGTGLAFPSQTIYLENPSEAARSSSSALRPPPTVPGAA